MIWNIIFSFPAKNETRSFLPLLPAEGTCGLVNELLVTASTQIIKHFDFMVTVPGRFGRAGTL